MAVPRMATEVEGKFGGLPYAGHGVCANPLCQTRGWCRGSSPTTRVCIGCFEFTYNCRAPRRIARGRS